MKVPTRLYSSDIGAKDWCFEVSNISRLMIRRRSCCSLTSLCWLPGLQTPAAAAPRWQGVCQSVCHSAPPWAPQSVCRCPWTRPSGLPAAVPRPGPWLGQTCQHAFPLLDVCQWLCVWQSVCWTGSGSVCLTESGCSAAPPAADRGCRLAGPQNERSDSLWEDRNIFIFTLLKKYC